MSETVNNATAERPKPSDAAEWIDRHNLECVMHIQDAGCAFEDAWSLGYNAALSTARREHAEVVAAKDVEINDLRRERDDVYLHAAELQAAKGRAEERLAKLRANWQPVSEKLSGGGDIEEYDEPIDYLNQILADRDLLRARVEEATELLRSLGAFVAVMVGRGPDAVIPATIDTPLGVPVQIGKIMQDVRAFLPPDPATSGGEKPKVGDRCVECVGHTKPDGYFCGYCGCWCRPDGTSDSHAPDQTTESPQPERGGGA
jgi:hypothetical protein